MKRCRQCLALPNQYRILAFSGNDFDAGTGAFDPGRADEDHFNGLVEKLPFADRTIDLAAVGIAADGDVERAESGLFRILYFRCQQNRASTGPEGWFLMDEIS